METHLQIKVAMETYLAEHEKFEQNGVKPVQLEQERLHGND